MVNKKELIKRMESMNRKIDKLQELIGGEKESSLSYDVVVKAADEMMSEGRAISVGILAKRMGLEKGNERAVKKQLDKAVDDGRYEMRKEPMFAFKINFSVYSPKGKDLPYLPSNMSLRDYDALLGDSLGLVYSLPSRFTQQKFHEYVKVLGKAKGISAQGVTMSIPSILRTYVKKGILETKDGNTYTKNYDKVQD